MERPHLGRRTCCHRKSPPAILRSRQAWPTPSCAVGDTACSSEHCMLCVHAGADVATTASYQATFEGFERAGFGRSDAEELLRRSVRLADSARTDFWARQQAAVSGGVTERRHRSTQSCCGRRLCDPTKAWVACSYSDGAGSKPGLQRRRARPLVAFSCGPYAGVLADGSEYTGSYAARMSEEQLMDFHRQRLLVLYPSPLEPCTLLASWDTVLPCLHAQCGMEHLHGATGCHGRAWPGPDRV